MIPSATPHPCRRDLFLSSRRSMLARCAGGFGAAALLALPGRSDSPAPDARPRTPHHKARARQVIFLYMDGGPSQIDTFDPKPLLAREHGKPFAMKKEATQFNDNGNTLASPWAFRRYGQSGLPVSDLFPHVATCADELCVIRSMVSEFSEHTNANYFLHTGLGIAGRPSAGAWVGYGLGSENRNLPGFVVVNGGLVPPGGLDNFSSGFLPASHQASLFRPTDPPLANIKPAETAPGLQRNKVDFIRRMDRRSLLSFGDPAPVEAAISNFELAFRMQSAVPELTDISGETAATRALYGLDAPFPQTRTFGAQCLLARRLVERGVRFIELTCPSTDGDRWDQHGNLKKGHEDNARAVDQPIAGLLKDLRSRGLLDETLVIWGGEFGRTPFAQGRDGRDHNPFGFSMWMAGGGVKGGMTYGATDEYGYKVVENKVEVYDLHATMLHLLGIDHTRLTYRFGGRDMRLTDVHGNVLHDLLA